MKKEVILTIVFVFIVCWVSLAVFLVKQKSATVEKRSGRLDRSIVQERYQPVDEIKPNYQRPMTIARPVSPEPEPQHLPAVSGPHALNIDFGVWRPGPSKQVGSAAVGNTGDYWNTVGVAWNDNHLEYNLKSTQNEWSPIQVRLINLGGGWGNSGGMGVKDPMLDGFNYPQNNQGGNSEVILYQVPPGRYNLYIYGHGTNPVYYGDYTLMVGERNYGRQATSNQIDAVENTQWVEGSQYVKFANIGIDSGENIRIIIQPGGQVSDNNGARIFSDAIICGLQLIPAAVKEY